MSMELVMPPNHFILCSPLLLLPSIFPCIRIFSKWVSSSHQVAKVLELQFSISPSNDYSGFFFFFFRIDWFDLLAVQETLKSLLQYHSSKASILQHSAFSWRRKWQSTPVFLPGEFHRQRSLAGCSPWSHRESDTTEWLTHTHRAFFMVQLSHLYMTAGKTTALNIPNTVGKVIALLFTTLSRFVIASLPRSQCLLISWLQSLSRVILEPKKIKSVTSSTLPPSTCHEVIGLDAMILATLSFKSAFFTLLFHPHQEALYFLFTFCH